MILLSTVYQEKSSDNSWFHRLNEFEQQETRRQVVFKRYSWPKLVDGVWNKRPNYQYPHILPRNSLEKVFFTPVAKEIISYLGEEKIAKR